MKLFLSAALCIAAAEAQSIIEASSFGYGPRYDWPAPSVTIAGAYPVPNTYPGYHRTETPFQGGVSGARGIIHRL